MMSLPPGFLDELRTRVSISQVVGRKVMWDQRKSNQAKGDMWAPCPFHQEKTASFHVDDRKGFYYCFGCQAKGDALGFIKETENVSFMEAVEILAREAGMQMPARDPQAQQKLDRAAMLAKATEAAVGYFRLQLKTGAGGAARDYLERRGLDAATLERFEIGFAPAGRQAAFAALTGKGLGADEVIEAGIAAKPDDGGAPYDAFRDRIMFPIRDPRGRCIGFGGRAMAETARAKYLNSRETPLFDKGRALYNHGPAREAAGKGATLIVAEGYMDVIALVKAGFGAAVAPLGTAVTEDQLRLLWRIADEPVITLDGDTAGQRAAMRLVDLAMPLLEPGKTLRFAVMPQGQDPDDLIRTQGREAMQAQLDASVPLVQMLWRRETEGHVFDSPERRAALDQRLRRAIGQIPDRGLRRHYGEALSEMRRALFHVAREAPRQKGAWSGGYGGRPPRGGAWSGFAEAQLPLAETRSSALGSGAYSADHLRVSLILATLARYPALVERFEGELERIVPEHRDHAALADLLMSGPVHDAGAFEALCGEKGLMQALETLRGIAHVRLAPFLSGAPAPEAAERCLAEEFAKHLARHGWSAEMEEALEDLRDVTDDGDPRLARRVNHAVLRRQQAEHPGGEGQAARLVTEDTMAMSDGLRALIEARAWEKKKK